MINLLRRMSKRTHIKVEIEDETVSKYFKKVKAEEPEEKFLYKFSPIDIRKESNTEIYFAMVNQNLMTDLADKPLVDAPTFPKNFVTIYLKVRDMRSKIITPVDSVGCAELPLFINKPHNVEVTPRNYRFQLLVSLMLSSQTKDEVNAQAMTTLFTHCLEKDPHGITLEAITDIDEKTLDECIAKVGFHKRKANFIKRACAMLVENFEGDVPFDIAGMTSLPGVGPKMGFLALQKAWGLNDGIGVDVHVDRLAKMWRWVDAKKCKTPDHTRKALEDWLPRELWYEINPMLVGFGQVICMSKGARCDICTLGKICPGFSTKAKPGATSRGTIKLEQP